MFTDKKPLKRLGLLSGVVNTQLKQGVNDRSVDAKHICGRRPPLQVIRERRRFVTAAQNRVVQIGRVGFSGIKRYDYSLMLCIYPDVAHSFDAHERLSQFAHAFIAILPFRRDRDSLQHRFVCALQVMRIGWIEMMRIEWFDHRLIYAPGRAAPVLVLKDTSCIAQNVMCEIPRSEPD
jgi:hypothetical protein